MTVTTAPQSTTLEFARAVALGLSDTPRWLPARFLYDAEGSALFERICGLPEYYPTRTEAAILARSASAIAARTGPVTLIELGSGSSVKTDTLLEAYAASGEAVRYVPVDVSDSMLELAARRIRARFPSVTVDGVHGEYHEGFARLREDAPAMLIFLGSTIGNLNHAESLSFWGDVADAMPEGGYVLLGVDLVKDPTILEAAYNDAQGVSAAFTKNIFARMNRELGAGLDLAQIEHVAAWNAEWQRIEIGGRFLSTQQVHVRPLGRTFTIEAGALVMTEISRKFVPEHLQEYLACFGFALEQAFADERNWFAVLLLRKGSTDGDLAR